MASATTHPPIQYRHRGALPRRPGTTRFSPRGPHPRGAADTARRQAAAEELRAAQREASAALERAGDLQKALEAANAKTDEAASRCAAEARRLATSFLFHFSFFFSRARR